MINNFIAESNDYTSHDPLLQRRHFRRFIRCRTNITRLSKDSQRNLMLLYRYLVHSNRSVSAHKPNFQTNVFWKIWFTYEEMTRFDAVTVRSLSHWFTPLLRIFPRCKTTHRTVRL